LPCSPDYKGYCRDFEKEARLNKNVQKAYKEASIVDIKFEGMTPISHPIPSWWEGGILACQGGGDPVRNRHLCDSIAVTKDGRFRPDTRLSPDEVIDYLQRAKNFLQAKVDNYKYACTDFPRDTAPCQHAAQLGGTLGKINRTIITIKQGQEAYLQEKRQQKIDEELQAQKRQDKINEDYRIKEEKAWTAKRNKTLLLIGSLFLFG